jgi:hypothetical protein
MIPRPFEITRWPLARGYSEGARGGHQYAAREYTSAHIDTSYMNNHSISAPHNKADYRITTSSLSPGRGAPRSTEVTISRLISALIVG